MVGVATRVSVGFHSHQDSGAVRLQATSSPHLQVVLIICRTSEHSITHLVLRKWTAHCLQRCSKRIPCGRFHPCFDLWNEASHYPCGIDKGTGCGIVSGVLFFRPRLCDVVCDSCFHVSSLRRFCLRFLFSPSGPAKQTSEVRHLRQTVSLDHKLRNIIVFSTDSTQRTTLFISSRGISDMWQRLTSICWLMWTRPSMREFVSSRICGGFFVLLLVVLWNVSFPFCLRRVNKGFMKLPDLDTWFSCFSTLEFIGPTTWGTPGQFHPHYCCQNMIWRTATVQVRHDRRQHKVHSHTRQQQQGQKLEFAPPRPPPPPPTPIGLEIEVFGAKLQEVKFEFLSSVSAQNSFQKFRLHAKFEDQQDRRKIPPSPNPPPPPTPHTPPTTTTTRIVKFVLNFDPGVWSLVNWKIWFYDHTLSAHKNTTTLNLWIFTHMQTNRQECVNSQRLRMTHTNQHTTHMLNLWLRFFCLTVRFQSFCATNKCQLAQSGPAVTHREEDSTWWVLVTCLILIVWISTQCAFLHLFFKSTIILLTSFKDVTTMITSSTKRKLDTIAIFRHSVQCPSPFHSKCQWLSPLLICEPLWTESCSKNQDTLFHEQSRTHQSPHPSMHWPAGQSTLVSTDKCIAHWQNDCWEISRLHHVKLNRCLLELDRHPHVSSPISFFWKKSARHKMLRRLEYVVQPSLVNWRALCCGTSWRIMCETLAKNWFRRVSRFHVSFLSSLSSTPLWSSACTCQQYLSSVIGCPNFSHVRDKIFLFRVDIRGGFDSW